MSTVVFGRPRADPAGRGARGQLHVADEVRQALAVGECLAGFQHCLAVDSAMGACFDAGRQSWGDLRRTRLLAVGTAVPAWCGMGHRASVIRTLGGAARTRPGLCNHHRARIGGWGAGGAVSRGALILAGLAVMVAGIAVSARAGGQREQGRKPEAGAGYALALAMAVFCGLLAPMINYSFAFGQDIAVRAIKLGISPERAGYAVWPVTLAGGLLPNLGYCLYLLFRKKTWSLFRGPWLPDAGHATLMAVFWMGAMSVYGVAAVYLGALGTSVGWGLFQIFMIMTANFGGVITGEWAAAPRSALRTLYAGLGLLAVATLMLAGGDR